MSSKNSGPKSVPDENISRTVRSAFTRIPRKGIDFTLAEPLTKQSFKDECDINNIMRKFAKTGVIAHGNANTPEHGDIPEIDFRQAMEVVLQAERSFDELPAGVRRRFDNNPADYLSFMEQPENIEEAISLGLAEIPPPVLPPNESIQAPPAPDTPPPPKEP